MTYAIVKCGGKQMRVSEGETVVVEKLEGPPGTAIELPDVFLYHDGVEAKVGRPTVAGVKVLGEVLRQGRGKKLMVFKDRNRKSLRKHQGHRQWYTELRIKQIVAK